MEVGTRKGSGWNAEGKRLGRGREEVGTRRGKRLSNNQLI